jgi:hypothetical protein
VSAAVLDQRVRLEINVVDGCLTGPTRPVRTSAQPLKRTVYVVQGGLDLGHALVSKFTHPTNLPVIMIVAVRSPRGRTDPKTRANIRDLGLCANSLVGGGT